MAIIFPIYRHKSHIWIIRNLFFFNSFKRLWITKCFAWKGTESPNGFVWCAVVYPNLLISLKMINTLVLRSLQIFSWSVLKNVSFLMSIRQLAVFSKYKNVHCTNDILWTILEINEEYFVWNGNLNIEKAHCVCWKVNC